MASSPSSHIISFCHSWLFIFAVYVTIASKSVTSQSPLISSICGRTNFVDFCKQALMSYPGSASADLHGLGVITDALTIRNVSAALRKVQYLINRSELISPERERLMACKTGYRKVLHRATRMKILWGSGKVVEARGEALTAIDGVAECRSAFGAGRISPLASNNLNVERLLRMAITICNASPRRG